MSFSCCFELRASPSSRCDLPIATNHTAPRTTSLGLSPSSLGLLCPFDSRDDVMLRWDQARRIIGTLPCLVTTCRAPAATHAVFRERRRRTLCVNEKHALEDELTRPAAVQTPCSLHISHFAFRISHLASPWDLASLPDCLLVSMYANSSVPR